MDMPPGARMTYEVPLRTRLPAGSVFVATAVITYSMSHVLASLLQWLLEECLPHQSPYLTSCPAPTPDGDVHPRLGREVAGGVFSMIGGAVTANSMQRAGEELAHARRQRDCHRVLSYV